MNRSTLCRRNKGFTYLGILLVVALLGTGMAAVGALWSIQVQRAREQALLDVGLAYQRAIESYYLATPRGTHEYPTSLAALVRDNRGGQVKRHLRELYADPMTGAADWRQNRLADGAIVGIYSSSQRKPLKRANFPGWTLDFEGRQCVCDWQFAYLPALAN